MKNENYVFAEPLVRRCRQLFPDEPTFGDYLETLERSLGSASESSQTDPAR